MLVSAWRTALLLTAVSLGGIAPQAYRKTAAEEDLGFKLAALERNPLSARPPLIPAMAARIRALRPSPEKIRLATRLTQPALDAEWPDETVRPLADLLAGTLAEDPNAPADAQRPACEVLADLACYHEIPVALDTPAYGAALAERAAKTKRRQAVDFTLPDLEGKTWNLKSLKGKVVLVNFWNLGCAPCLAEMPGFERTYGRLKDQGFVILALTNDAAPSVERYRKDHPMSFPILLDPTLSVSRSTDVVGIPVSLLYDREGRLVGESLGPWSEAGLARRLERLGLR